MANIYLASSSYSGTTPPAGYDTLVKLTATSGTFTYATTAGNTYAIDPTLAASGDVLNLTGANTYTLNVLGPVPIVPSTTDTPSLTINSASGSTPTVNVADGVNASGVAFTVPSTSTGVVTVNIGQNASFNDIQTGAAGDVIRVGNGGAFGNVVTNDGNDQLIIGNDASQLLGNLNQIDLGNGNDLLQIGRSFDPNATGNKNYFLGEGNDTLDIAQQIYSGTTDDWSGVTFNAGGVKRDGTPGVGEDIDHLIVRDSTWANELLSTLQNDFFTDANNDGTWVAAELYDNAVDLNIAQTFWSGFESYRPLPSDLRDGIVSGTSGNDFIDINYTGDPQGDRIDNSDAINYGTPGSNDDSVQAGAGNDTILSGLGNDSILAGTGNDSVNAGTGNDIIYGDDTAGTLAGGGNDTLLGGDGNDTIISGTGKDSVDGGDGNDSILGNLGDDTITGGAGNDTIIGGPLDCAPPPLSTASGLLSWKAMLEPGEADPGNLADGFTTTVGGVGITYSFANNTTNGAIVEKARVFVPSSTAARDQMYKETGEPFATDSGLSLTKTADADPSKNPYISTSTFTFDTAISNVTFRINDLDKSSVVTEQVQIFAYDSAGNLVPVDITDSPTASPRTQNLVEGDNTTNASVSGTNAMGTTTYPGNEWGSVLVQIPSAITKLVLVFNDTNLADNGAGDVYISDIAFGTTYPGSTITQPETDNDLLSGGLGSDLVHGGRGNDTILAGEGDTVHGDCGDDLIKIDTVLKSDTTPGATIFVYGGETGEKTGGDTLDLGTLPNGALKSIIYDGTPDQNGGLNGTITLTDGTIIKFFEIEKIICFAEGTAILTASGEVPVESLKVGSLVATRDRGIRPIRWIGKRKLTAADLEATPALRPIRIKAGALGCGLPERDLVVSPQHRVLLRSKVARRMFGVEEVLVGAKQLVMLPGIDIATDLEEVTYVHFLFDRHELVWSNGTLTESLYTGMEALRSVGAAACEEIFTLFPELRSPEVIAASQPAATLTSGRQARKLAMRLMQNRRPPVEAASRQSA